MKQISAGRKAAFYFGFALMILGVILLRGLMIGFGRGIAILAPLLTGYMLSHYWTPVDAYSFFAIVMGLSAVATIALHLTFRKASTVPVQTQG